LWRLKLAPGARNYSDFNGAAAAGLASLPLDDRSVVRQGFSLIHNQRSFVMSTFISAVRTFIADEEGVTALEYGMIAALIAAVIVGVVTDLGTSVQSAFTKIATAIDN
jgi:pilus assembly protein Flp/PilA